LGFRRDDGLWKRGMGIADFNGRRSEKEKRNFVMEMTLKKLSLLQGRTYELTTQRKNLRANVAQIASKTLIIKITKPKS
jgi:hypothetical protein